MSSLPTGATIDQYRIESELGSGSMGEVYRGVDANLGRKVALKILLDRHRDNDELRARFVREARAVAAISHPNVVQVFTTGTYDGRPYIAMEFLDGSDLGSAVDERGPWDSLAAARAVLDAARGLEAAAAAGLIHRDVKPSNLVLLDTGRVKVTDFGLAKPADPGASPALTALGVVVGTPDYIAPEQARGDPIDARVDIYALGCSLYFLLTGNPPFRTGRANDDKYLKVVARHLRDPAPDARKRNPDADPELAELALAMMAKKAPERPTYPELLARLEAMIKRLEAAATAPSRSAAGRSTHTPLATPAQRPPEPVGPPAAGDDDDDADAAATNLRASRSHDTPSESIALPAPRVSRWLVSATVLSALVFFTGLGLLVFGPMPAPRHAPAADAGAGPARRPDAGAPRPLTPLPIPPAGMVLVTHPDGRPWFFIDQEPLTAKDFVASLKRKRGRPTGLQPVTNVSHAEAVTYANLRGKRLPSTLEWESGRTFFAPAGPGLWEWIADGAAPTAPHAVRQAGANAMRAGTRPPAGQPDVTFRLAQDLPR